MAQARARLDALKSVVWRLRICRSEARRAARHAEEGRHLADEDIRAFQDYLALTLRDLSRMGAAEEVA